MGTRYGAECRWQFAIFRSWRSFSSLSMYCDDMCQRVSGVYKCLAGLIGSICICIYTYLRMYLFLYLFVNSFVFVLRWEEIYHGVTGHSWVSRLGEQGSIWSNRNRYWERALWSISRRNVIRIKDKKLDWYGLNSHLFSWAFHNWFNYQFSCENFYEYYSKGCSIS